jgi:hypothetical protein
MVHSTFNAQGQLTSDVYFNSAECVG